MSIRKMTDQKPCWLVYYSIFKKNFFHYSHHSILHLTYERELLGNFPQNKKKHKLHLIYTRSFSDS